MILTSLASSISKLSMTRLADEAESASAGLSSMGAIQQYGLTAAEMQAIADESDAKARAAKKIADAKEQLEFLQRGGFPPDVIARLAGQLAGQLQSAAAQFAQAIAASASSAASANQTVSAIAPEGQTTANPGQDPSVVGDDGSRTNLFQRAYQSVAEDREGLMAGREEEDILSELEALIRQAGQLERTQQSDLEVPASR